MTRNLTIVAIALLLPSPTSAQSLRLRQPIPKFLGHDVTVLEPETDADGFHPKGPASICVESMPQRQCYTAPDGFGREPSVELVQVEKEIPALLFSAASGGVSGWEIHFALLRPGTGKDLNDLFSSRTSVSNLSQHEFWNDSTISAAKIFVTADFVWGSDESHYDGHRFIISAYALKHPALTGDLAYYLEDRYMTARKYDLDANENVLTSEKREIIARLRRLRTKRGG